MHAPIRTCHHRVIDAVNAGRFAFKHDGKWLAQPGLKEEVRSMIMAAAHFPRLVIEYSLMSSWNQSDVEHTISTLQKVDKAKPPFKDLVVEVIDGKRIHMVVIQDMQDASRPDHYVCEVITLYVKDNIDRVFMSTLCYWINFNKETNRVDYKCVAHSRSGGQREFDRLYSKNDDQFHADNAEVAASALCATLVVFSTRGIVRESNPRPEKLNKARAKVGKAEIPEYTYIRIGTYTTRLGKVVNYDSRKPVRLHWRRAHTRTQHYGPGNKQTKEIMIEAVLVNYDPASEAVPAIPVYLPAQG